MTTWRALRLFGQTPAVCDDPSTVARIDPNRPEVRIVHVRGSHLFYDCANLRGEVRGRARLDRGTSQTVLGFLDSVLWSRSPLVMGYSGWEGDVIMSALRRRLGGGHPLGQNLYWFCYERKVAEGLPKWLTENTHVRLVAPAEEPSASAEPMRAGLGEAAGAGPGERTPEVSPKLTARTVFEKLIEVFGVEEPALFQNPIQHFANLLEDAFLRNERPAVDADPYKVRAVVQLMRDAAAGKAEARTDVVSKLEAVRKAIRRPRYRDAIVACAHFVPFRLGELSADQRMEVLNAAALAGDAVLSKGQPGGDRAWEPAFIKELAQVLSVDIRREEQLGPMPPGMVVVFPRRLGQIPMERFVEKEPRGAFSFAFEQAMVGALSSKKQTGAPSLQELVVEAGVHMLNPFWQAPVLVGDGLGTTVFAGRRPPSASSRAKGRLRALLVGINKYEIGANLAGGVNDVDAFARLLETHDAEFGHPRKKKVVNQGATARLITKALGELVASGHTDDILLFHFSGRMTSLFDPTGESPGARDVLVTHEYDGKGAGMILLSDVIKQLAKAKAKHKGILLN